MRCDQPYVVPERSENRSGDRQLWQIDAGEYFALQPKQLIRLSRDKVLFFESAPPRNVPVMRQLAA